MDSERLSEVIIKDTSQHNGKILVWQEVELGEKYGEKFEIEIFNYNPVMCSVDSPSDTVEVYFVLSSPFLKIKTIDYKIGMFTYTTLNYHISYLKYKKK